MRGLTKCLIMASLWIACTLQSQALPLQSIALYYGENIPVDELKAFDAVVLHPTAKFDPNRWQSKQSELFAYISVGEVDRTDPEFPSIKKSWLLGENKTWGSVVVDWRNPEWQQFFLDQEFESLWQKGYRNFFLDTLDSYQLAVQAPAGQAEQQAAFIRLIKEMKRRHPSAKLIFNRGFEVVPKLSSMIYAVAAESLFSGWDQARARYYPIPPDERQWLLNELAKIQNLKIPVISIDYMEPSKRNQAKEIAKKISKLNIIPYVTNSTLTQVGVSSVSVIPRKIMMLYIPSNASTEMDDLAFTGTAMPLEYLGYVPQLVNVKNELPADELLGRYAGIVVLLTQEEMAMNARIKPWLLKQVEKKIPIVFLETIPFNLQDPLAGQLGLLGNERLKKPNQVSILKKDPSLDFEIPLNPSTLDFTNIQSKNSDVYLKVQGNDGQTSDAIAITPWGGYALAPYFITNLSKEKNRWVLDPFVFLPKALRLPVLPVPETTTENGVRLMIVHIDGDGFVSRGEWSDAPVAGKVMLDSILQEYKIPTTVSVIEGEIGAKGLYPDLSLQLEEIARNIFNLPWVEVASHTFSHPFNWRNMQSGNFKQFEHLPVKNYAKLDMSRELVGSIDYINQRLVDKNKPCRLLLWSGMANPTSETLQILNDNHLLNLNGGLTRISKDASSLTDISPLGIILNGQYQIFAAMTNENEYTNSWTGPFWGFRRVIETFQMTETPRRLRPINIYYHFYSASKLASLQALKEVYDWALSQEVMPIYASDYANKVMNFYQAVYFNRDDAFVIRSPDVLKEIRVPSELGLPNLQTSRNLIGYNPYQNANYVHLGENLETSLVLTASTDKKPRLYSATGKISDWRVNNKNIRFDITSLRPMTFKLADAANCKAYDGRQPLAVVQSNAGLSEYRLGKDGHHVTIQCN